MPIKLDSGPPYRLHILLSSSPQILIWAAVQFRVAMIKKIKFSPARSCVLAINSGDNWIPGAWLSFSAASFYDCASSDWCHKRPNIRTGATKRNRPSRPECYSGNNAGHITRRRRE
ncbi:hypothetical protein FRC10_004721 [Ceratobasidium sp. 414]|nr:hypothetical protein FRC10_004721 [Ceratobasidium sp. 414]